MELINKILPEDLIYAMKMTQQEKMWHGENDVYTHTVMVLNEVEKLDIIESDKDILRYVAVLHDIGKTITTTEENGILRSHKHSEKSYSMSIPILDKLDLDFLIKLQILNLIKYHGRPLFICEKSEPEREIIFLSQNCRLDLLYYFSSCDFLGRIADDIPESLYKIDFLKLYAIDLDCFDKPYNFSNKITKFNYLVKRTHHFSDVAFDDTKSHIHIMCGLPGAGKDYYINKNFDIPVISLDKIRDELGIKPTEKQGKVIQHAKELAKTYMRKSQSFVWNATNITKKMRNELISFFLIYNSYITIHYVYKPIDIILQQNLQREDCVPNDVVLRLYRKMEIPTLDEAHEVIYQK